MTRSELIRRMSVSEIIDWMAFFKLDQEDQRRAQESAEDQAEAKRQARGMAGYR